MQISFMQFKTFVFKISTNGKLSGTQEADARNGIYFLPNHLTKFKLSLEFPIAFNISLKDFLFQASNTLYSVEWITSILIFVQCRIIIRNCKCLFNVPYTAVIIHISIISNGGGGVVISIIIDTVVFFV